MTLLSLLPAVVIAAVLTKAYTSVLGLLFGVGAGAVELMWAAVGDFPVRPLSAVMLLVWTVGAGLLAAWAYRRDEGRRFR